MHRRDQHRTLARGNGVVIMDRDMDANMHQEPVSAPLFCGSNPIASGGRLLQGRRPTWLATTDEEANGARREFHDSQV